MGISLAKLWNVFSENKEFKIIMVGLDNAGKVSHRWPLCTRIYSDDVQSSE